MKVLNLILLSCMYYFAITSGAVISDEIIEQGLYRKTDNVIILAQRNFAKKVYGRNNALVIQFYNSFCGHCRSFSPKYKALALDTLYWQKAIQLAVVDCSVEENIGLCRDFEVLAYPSIRYLHENYEKGASNVGQHLPITDTAEKLKFHIIKNLQSDQSAGYLKHIPRLSIASYATYSSALSDVPDDVSYTFLVFENDNSTVGSELILDTLDYKSIVVKRVYEHSELADQSGINKFPGLVVVESNFKVTTFTPRTQERKSLLNELNSFLKSKQYDFPSRDVKIDVDKDKKEDQFNLINADIIYYSDLENTIRNSLHTEVVRYKVLDGEVLQALLNYLQVLIENFPFRANGLKFITELKSRIQTKSKWSGNSLYELIKTLESEHYPVYSSELQYVACRGSHPKFRGYTCGLWTLFHTLTINAARNNNSGPKVLSAMHGYVKYFFGCTECSQHFQEMAKRNKIFDVKDSDKAVLWLWISHNEVNLRLAGDVTEDPVFPKIQFPSSEKCYNCRLAHGAWNLTAVYRYLQTMYSAENIQDYARPMSAVPNASPLSNVDIYLLSLLYILSFIIIILVIKLFLTKRLYRKRVYKYDGRGKV